MPLRPWDHLGEELLLRYKMFEVVRLARRSPRTGSEIGMFTIRTLDWVHVVAFTEDDCLVLVRQYRHGSSALSLELPGGAIWPADEPPAQAAARELQEETGFAAATLEPLGWSNPNPAIFDNRCHTFLARGCRRVAEPELDDGEDLEVVLLDRREVEARIRAGEIHNALVLAGLHLLQVHER